MGFRLIVIDCDGDSTPESIRKLRASIYQLCSGGALRKLAFNTYEVVNHEN